MFQRDERQLLLYSLSPGGGFASKVSLASKVIKLPQKYHGQLFSSFNKVYHYVWSRIYNGVVPCSYHLEPSSKPLWHQLLVQLEAWSVNLLQHFKNGGYSAKQEHPLFFESIHVLSFSLAELLKFSGLYSAVCSLHMDE
jgi:hypothetical protein